MPPTPVLIESLCRRPAGLNLIDMGDGTIYDFRDDGTGAQVALVSNPNHQRKLLSITEGFAFKGAAAAPLDVNRNALSVATGLPASFIPGEDPTNTITVQHSAPTAALQPPATVQEAREMLRAMGVFDTTAVILVAFPHLIPNYDAETAAANAEREAAAAAAVPASAPGSEPVEPVKPPQPVAPKEPSGDLSVSDQADLNGKTLAEIRAIYAEELGKAASPRHGIDVLVAKIESIRAERAKGPAN